MAGRKFNIAFSTIGTVPFIRFLKLVMTYGVYPGYYARCLVAGIISLLSEPFRWLENLLFSGKLSRTALPDSPVFILGHWRSGTTLLHNAMAQDRQFAFINTFQSVFANQFFGSRWLFKPLMKLLMPEKRPADNVLLSPELPQEEGIALSNIDSFGFYNFFYFPRRWKDIYKRYISGDSASPKELEAFGRRYKKLIAQSLIEYNRQQFISKFPPNTGAIRHLLDMFPQAKFVYIYRNPILVFQSTVNFFETTHEALMLQPYSKAEFEEMVFELYEMIIQDYERLKSLIPAQHLVEIRYEDFEADPLEGLRSIYERLELEGFEQSIPAFTDYFNSQKKFEKASHQFTPEETERITSRWRFAMEMYGYAMPEQMSTK
ncbi:MAG: sulfotransferase [Saprospiraceae bacterium]|nr:sulfotransferase [Candidatus Opimibacter skivensis]